MDGRLEAAEPKARPLADDPFAHMDAMLSQPAEIKPRPAPSFVPKPELAPQPEPTPQPEPARRPLQPGRMGQLAAIEESSLTESYPFPSTEPTSDPETVIAASTARSRPLMLTGLAGAVLVASALAYAMFLRSVPPVVVAKAPPAAPAPAAPAPATPMAPVPETVQAPTPAPPVKAAPPPQSPPPHMAAAPRTPKAKAKTPRRSRKSRRASIAPPSPTPASALDSAAAPALRPEAQAAAGHGKKDPLLEALLNDANVSPAETAEQATEQATEKSPPTIGQRPAANKRSFSMPGLKRPVSASARESAPPEPAEEAAEEAAPAKADVSSDLAEPGSAPAQALPAASVHAAEGEQLALVQVHEQFDFCSQLLTQGAYEDHFDTCLCRDARAAAPYLGRRGSYATAKKKEARDGRFAGAPKILSSHIDGGVATVISRWASAGSGSGRDFTQAWKLEDGLWCQAP